VTAAGLGTYVSPRGTMSGGDTQLRDLLIDIILDQENNRPRSMQTALGPSEIGDPCPRKLAYKISGMPEPESYKDDPWFAIIGTSVHTTIGSALERQNTLALARGEMAPWLIEQRVNIRTGLDGSLEGSLDAYNWLTQRVIDHKLVGVTSHRKYRRYGPSKVYHTQIQAYGVGAVRLGLKVDKVSIAFYPRFAGITEALYVWTGPFKPELVEKALKRLDIITELVRQLNPLGDPGKFRDIKAVPSEDCRLCPWLRPGTDTGDTCPGNLAGMTRKTGTT
jgi:hypothetical protein